MSLSFLVLNSVCAGNLWVVDTTLDSTWLRPKPMGEVVAGKALPTVSRLFSPSFFLDTTNLVWLASRLPSKPICPKAKKEQHQTHAKKAPLPPLPSGGFDSLDRMRAKGGGDPCDLAALLHDPLAPPELLNSTSAIAGSR